MVADSQMVRSGAKQLILLSFVLRSEIIFWVACDKCTLGGQVVYGECCLIVV